MEEYGHCDYTSPLTPMQGPSTAPRPHADRYAMPLAAPQGMGGMGVMPQQQQQQPPPQQHSPHHGQQQQPQQHHHHHHHHHMGAFSQPHGGSMGPPTGRVLLVVLRNLSCPVQLDRTFLLFSQFGLVEKLSTFVQHQQHQLVVQFQTADEANLAMGYLNGREWYIMEAGATCTLAIVPSRLQQLSFKKDDARNKDYTATNARLQEIMILLQNNNDVPRHAQDIELLFQCCGLTPTDFLWGIWVYGEGWLEPKQDASSVRMIPHVKGLPEGKIGECVHLANLPQDKGITALSLWACCGQYGELVAVKLLAQHKGCAIVQFKTKEDALFCIKNLTNVRLYNSKIFAQVSRNANATHWKGTQTELEKHMCTSEDQPPPAPAPPAITGPPSANVGAWGLPEDDPVTPLNWLLKPFGMLSCTDLGQGVCLLRFPSTEQAFEAICHTNGQVHMFQGQELKVCLHFPNETLTARAAGTTPPLHAMAGGVPPPPLDGTPTYSSFSAPSTQSSLLNTPVQLPNYNQPPISPQQQPLGQSPPAQPPRGAQAVMGRRWDALPFHQQHQNVFMSQAMSRMA